MRRRRRAEIKERPTDWRERLSRFAEALETRRGRPPECRARRSLQRRRPCEEGRMLPSLSERLRERLERPEAVTETLGGLGRRLREDRGRPRKVTEAPTPERETLSVDREMLSLDREMLSLGRETLSV